MAEEITIDKKPFSVDMKLVWACAAALVYFANSGSEWKSRVENFMTQQTTANAEFKKTPDRVQAVEADLREFKQTVTSINARLDKIDQGLIDVAQSTNSLKNQLAQLRADGAGGRRP